MNKKFLFFFAIFFIALSFFSWWYVAYKISNSPNKQMVVVIAKGSDANIFYIESDPEFKIRWYMGHVGTNGINANKREGDGCTPKGKFDLDYAFGMERVESDLLYVDITDDSYYVTDSKSYLYNSWSEGKQGFDEAEKLSDYPEEYKYAVSIGYNKERLAELGSAIFLHCSVEKPTAGCVAMKDENLKEVISQLDNDKNPCIIIMDSLLEIFNYL